MKLILKLSDMEQNNDMEWLDELTQVRAYDELSSAEKERVLKILGSEEQYNVLRKVSQACGTKLQVVRKAAR